MIEYWRKIRFWLDIPVAILDKIMSFILDYIPHLDWKYRELSAKIDSGLSLSSYILKEEPLEINLSDITNSKLRKSLIVSSIFGRWNIYYIRNIGEKTKINVDDSLRDVIYLSKDIIKKGDTIYTERISEWKLNSNYNSKKLRKYRRERGIDYGEFYKLEPQMYIVVAHHTFEHEEMQKERKVRSEYIKKINLEKLVNYAIRNDQLFTRKTNSWNWSRLPIFHKVVESDRIDLAQKLINSCIDDKERKKMVSYNVSNDGWESIDGKTPLDLAKSDDMKNLIKKYLNI